ncbi:nucleotide exchange factor GrpE [Metamycoplasma hyosynoviae]|uniref:nucleotide exchange factor GrpE n=1 Tax=Metamycoplasma hyosynoviae TaxID=29559 RepID=UPI00235A155C|nr:nucleotide exchange factor GrpE [Metamycoplasma hyosynoviae]MDC8916667.1 nucleotide exchange factor GrpE [Metamycoplasma hyosynoviae]MDI3063789.1 nucleotide exchange factor GrpE [Metamycoplasma hyosynoviae]
MKIRKYDYVEFTIVEYKNKKIQKTFPKEVIKIYIGLDPFDEKIENFLIGQEAEKKDEILTFVNPKDKKNTFEIKLLKYNKTPDRFVNFIMEMKYFQIQMTNLEEKAKNLEKKLAEEQAKYATMEIEFKKHIELMEAKAQQTIQEHIAKNDNHMKTIISEEKKFALQKFVENLIGPFDNFEVALNHSLSSTNESVAAYAKGFEMLYQQILGVLESFSITKIIPEIGEKFSPEIHQVYELVESDKPKDTILEVKNVGYRLHDRTIKPALVVVSK